MAIFSHSPIVGAVSGTIGSSVFVRGKSGPVIRKRAPVRHTKSEAQLGIRSALRLLRAGWHALSDADRTAWRSYAEDRPFPNRLNSLRLISGFNHFVRTNYQRALAALPLRTTPPPHWPFRWPNDFIAVFTAGGPFTIGPTPPFLPGGDTILVRGARPVSSSHTVYFARWRIVAIETTGIGGTIDVNFGFNRAFGQPLAGEIVGIRILMFDPVVPRTTWIEHAVTVA